MDCAFDADLTIFIHAKVNGEWERVWKWETINQESYNLYRWLRLLTKRTTRIKALVERKSPPRQPLICSAWGPLACLFSDCCRTHARRGAFTIASAAMELYHGGKIPSQNFWIRIHIQNIRAVLSTITLVSLSCLMLAYMWLSHCDFWQTINK